LTNKKEGVIMDDNVIKLFWRRVNNLEKQMEKTSNILWKMMWKDKLIELMKRMPDKRMIN
jgi:hypothetical protein